MIQDLYKWMLSWAESSLAIPALFLLAFAESSFFPLPPDVLLIALTLGKPDWGLYYAGITTLGSVMGAGLGYMIGWWGGRPLLLRLFGEDRVRSIQSVFHRYDAWAILIAGFTPIPYKLFTLAAGTFSLNLRVMIIASLIGRGARFFLVAGLIQIIGPQMKEIIEKYFNLVTLLVMGLLVLAVGLWHWQKTHTILTTDKEELVTEKL